LTSSEIGAALGLGRSAVSTVVREMEGWGVLSRVRPSGAGAWQSLAETDFVRIARAVVSRREVPFAASLRTALHEAEDHAASAVAPPLAVERLGRLRALAELSERALTGFATTSRLDLLGVWRMVGGKRFSLGSLRRVLVGR
jgi:DNA-binding transcriptional regulator GbsR (MarR family)